MLSSSFMPGSASSRMQHVSRARALHMQQRPVPLRLAVKVRASTAAPERPAKATCAKDSLYLFQWHRTQGAQGPEAARLVVDQLKTLEKVSKDALWFTVKESDAGDQHVLVVTGDRKTARKYSLTEVTEDSASVTLPGITEPVQIPVASLKASLMAMEDSDSDSSEDEDDTMTMKMKEEKKMEKEMKKERKAKEKLEKRAAALAVAESVPEGAAAREEAQRLVAAVTGAVCDMERTAEVVLGGLAKQERKKLKDAVKEVTSSAEKMKMQEEEDSSSCSSGSESDCEGNEKKSEKEAKMKMKDGKKEMMKGCDSSESDSSESDSDCEDQGKGMGKKEDKAAAMVPAATVSAA